MGGQGGHVPPKNLGYQLTLFGPRAADYVHHIITGPPIFLDDAASLYCVYFCAQEVKKHTEETKEMTSKKAYINRKR